MSQVELRGIVKRFGGNVVIPRLDLAIPAGKLTVLLGPSGCGKSTLLRIIAGLESPDEGAVWIDGRDATAHEPRDRNIAMVFQNYALYPHLTVRENLAFPLKVAKVARGEIDRRVAATAELLEITPLLDRLPRTLSGGERQRTAVGRAIIRDPRLFLFDEPLSNLDFQLRNQMRGELRALQQRLGKTAIYVTHDQTEAMTMADQLVVLSKGEIMQIGTPEEVFDRPANQFVAGFIGSPPMNFLAVSVRGGQVKTATEVISTSAAIADGEYILGIRPDHLTAGSESSPWTMIVSRIEYHGAVSYAIGSSGGAELMARLGPGLAAGIGSKVRLSFESQKGHFFERETKRRV